MSVKKSVNALSSIGNAVCCFVKDGKLSPSNGYGRICNGCPGNVKLAVYSAGLRAYLILAGSQVYFSSNLRTFVPYCEVDGESQPFAVKYTQNDTEDVIIFLGKCCVHYFNGVSLGQSNLDYALSCGVQHCGRLFAGDADDGLMLRWTGIGNISMNSEGIRGSGYLRLDPQRGDILNLIVYKGKIVAVREYGLTVLSMYGSPENFSVDFTDTDCDKIYKNTVQTVADKLYFYSESGLKCFDGSKISAIELNHFITEPTASAKYGDKYFVTGTSSYLERKVILCVRMPDFENCIMDTPADAFFIDDGLNFFRSTSLFKFDDGARYSFESGPIDFGTGRAKTVSAIDLRGGKADLRISNGVCTRIFKNASGIVRPHLRGKNFTVSVEGRNPLEGITVTAEVTDEI